MSELIIVLIIIYFVQSIVYMVASYKRFPKLSEDKLPSASVIVAVRNEEEIILRCLESLDKLEYPAGKLQIIVVDDRSTDKTGEIIDDFIRGKERFLKISGEEPSNHLRGKTNALVQGLRQSTGEVILTTDADCAVNPLWAKTLSSYFTENVGLCGGITSQSRGSIWNGMQHLDFIYLLGVGAGTVNVGLPLSVIGNNMAYLRKAYDETGGYEAMPFSVTEDSQLLAAISELGKYKIIYPVDRFGTVESMPVATLKTLFRQKKRWSLGGIQVPFHGLLVLASTVVAHLAPLVLFWIAPFYSLLLLGVIIVSDLLFQLSMLSRMKLLSSIIYFPFFELYYYLYVTVMPFILLFSRSVEWKGRKF
ncbi:MAG: glycosyltransferase [Ignavibacteriales bacterium]|nr:MAG: glycosyltransferase [Ignavibacteriaceae bacterium]MBW7872906.1 glycosyltransferase [Ignavibacteria bacterium]MCZ2142465.1 glycosyltransferase [Ignavibacteriales bacterium]OQY76289.1 MAG: hypothetical protein B6D45_04095 [Ignavibacteriales bacterium UTCHB3]MBV6445347.1 hypothetical protein [Ignavibacteriaceae bacterium]